MSDETRDKCDVCHALPGDWCEPWCPVNAEAHNPATIADKDATIATLRAALAEAVTWIADRSSEDSILVARLLRHLIDSKDAP